MPGNEPKRVNVAFIGCGVVGRRHAECFRGDRRVEVAVCSDPSREAAARLRNEFFPQAEIETDASRAIAGHGARAAVICSPTTVHYEQCCQAFEAGLDVLCEKPLADRREQIVDLIGRAVQTGRLLLVGYQRRYKAPYVTARREFTERAEWYGPLRQVHLYVCERWQQTIHGTWRDDPRVGAGYFGDAGSHQIDVVNFITGERPTRVFALSERRGSQVEITTQAMSQLTSGAGLFAHFVGDANHWREDIHFHCRDGDLLLRSEKIYRAKENRVEEIFDLAPDGSPDAAFIDAILDGKPIVSGPEIALPMYDWTEAVLRSNRERAWVSVGDPSGGRK
ncbi:MAG TPA: Gfo/Idh/MocA family oxidoreductase [Pirellulales bacterium]|nr:Gfo/Idh/MocA family oxidoreductase [Pirellulales bacterium]